MSGFIRQIILLLFSWQFLTMALVWHHEKVNTQSTENALTKQITSVHTLPKCYLGTEFRNNIICSVANRELTSFDYIQQTKRKLLQVSYAPWTVPKQEPTDILLRDNPLFMAFLFVLSSLTWVIWTCFLSTLQIKCVGASNPLGQFGSLSFSVFGPQTLCSFLYNVLGSKGGTQSALYQLNKCSLKRSGLFSKIYKL